MQIEHFALNVAEPVAMAAWYVEHLGLRIAVGSDKPPYAHFLADANDDSAQPVMLEIYHNSAELVPDYAAWGPNRVHLAFVSQDPAADAARLIAAGASHVEDVPLAGGGLLVTLRDPWGLALQVVRR
jgi:catechol 2,3-dioxygenase-like lactoylglutathione lyase family enzyme